MAFYLDHTIVPALDKEASARFFARIFGLEYRGLWGPFAPVKVNETLTMDFDDRGEGNFQVLHYAFITSDGEFDTVLQRVKDEGLPFGSGPFALEDGQINQLFGGRGFYFRDPNGHVLEVIGLTPTSEHRVPPNPVPEGRAHAVAAAPAVRVCRHGPCLQWIRVSEPCPASTRPCTGLLHRRASPRQVQPPARQLLWGRSPLLPVKGSSAPARWA